MSSMKGDTKEHASEVLFCDTEKHTKKRTDIQPIM